MDLLAPYYLTVKSLHIISVIAWMAGIFYLPRLMAYHADTSTDDLSKKETFVVMERRLFRGIMNPAMIATWIFGPLLVLTPGVVDWSLGWPWVKAAMVLVMTWFHHWLGRRRKELEAGTCKVSSRSFKIMNELPTILMIVIVFMVVMKPF